MRRRRNKKCPRAHGPGANILPSVFAPAYVSSRNVGEGLAPPAGWQLWILHAPRRGMHPLPSPRGRCPRRGRMRAGEHLRIALHAQQNATAPRPSSVCGALAPQTASPRGSQGASANRRCPKRTILHTGRRGKPLPTLRLRNWCSRKGRCGHRPLQTVKFYFLPVEPKPPRSFSDSWSHSSNSIAGWVSKMRNWQMRSPFSSTVSRVA